MKSPLSILSEWALFSLFMFTTPFGAYFGTKHVLETRYPHVAQENAFLGTLLPVVSAVLTVWVIIALYAYIAWRDEFRNKPKPETEAEKNKEENKKDD